MRLALGDADVAFRDELRDFFSTKIPADIRERARNEDLRYPDDLITAPLDRPVGHRQPGLVEDPWAVIRSSG